MASPAEPLGEAGEASMVLSARRSAALRGRYSMPWASKFLADAKVEELRGLGTAALVNVRA